MKTVSLMGLQVSVLSSPDEWSGAFADHLREGGKSERTVEAYLQDLRSFAAWYAQVNGEELSPDLITSFDLRAYRKYALVERKLKPSTWNRWRSALVALCRWAVAAGWLYEDPTKDIKGAKVAELPPRWLDRRQANRLMRQAERLVNAASTDRGRWQALRDRAMLAIMLYAGLREAEVVALDAGDIEIGERSGRVRVYMGKGDVYREVPLSKEARLALSAWLEVRGNPAPLFTSKQGDGRLSTRAVIYRVAEVGRLARIDGLTPHDLRHTCAKRMLDEGAPLTVVQRILGHRRLATTARYVQPGWGDLEDAVETI